MGSDSPKMKVQPSTPVPVSSVGSVVREASASIATVLKAVRKNWPLVVASTILFAGSSLLLSKSLPKVYDATALLELNVSISRPLGDKMDAVMPMTAIADWTTQEYYETQYRIVTSERVLGAVARDLNLQWDLDFFGNNTAREKPPTAEDAAALLRARLRVEPVKNSRLFILHFEDTDPKRARRISSAIANTYIEQNLQIAINGTADAVVWLDGQLDHVKQDLETNENALHTFKQVNELPSTSINEASNMVRLEMQTYTEALSRTRTHKEELLARYAELEKISDSNPDDLPASELLSNPFLQSVRTQYQAAVKEKMSLLGAGKGENHPLVKAADESIAETKAALLREVGNIKGAVERDKDVVIREEAGELALFDEARERAVALNMKEIEYHRLDRARDQNEKLYSLLLERSKDADMARMMKVNNIRVVDEPLEPKKPVRPRVALNFVLGLAIGLSLGAAMAWLREILDASIKTPEDIEQLLGITFVGLLPAVEDGTNGTRRQKRRARSRQPKAPLTHPELIVHEAPSTAIAEAARSIRTNLLFMSPDRPYRTLLVTSAAPAEGKTTVACSVSIALAQGGQHVCIVDCDLRRPRLHRIFERVGDPGVTNFLIGDAKLDDVAKPTMIDNLWSIPAGPVPPNPADLFHSESFRRFLRELAERFDRVVIDSPPVAAVTDAAIISTLVDGTLFVIRAFETSHTLCRQSLRTLADVDAPVVGAVLNAVNFDKHEYKYYQYYYYKRDGYYSSALETEGAQPGAPPN
jgi:succinoglycan biosynthesis transport protein ExoP